MFTLESVTRSDLDAFFDLLDDAMKQTPHEEAFLALIDFTRNAGLAVTPYYRKRALEVASRYPNLYGRIAYLVAPGMQLTIAAFRWFIFRDRQASQRYVQFDLFWRRGRAIQWLES
jgi:hypothetical protein